MKTKGVRRILCEAFGFDTWAEFRWCLIEAREPYPITLSWKCIALGRRKNPRLCIFDMALGEDTKIDAHCVFEHYSYIRFKGDECVFRYLNPSDMREEIHSLDAEGWVNSLEGGDSFILEPLAKTAARSQEYQTNRREAIRNGTHVVKPRGPNPEMRRQPIHHYRPY